MRHGLSGLFTYKLNDHRKENEHPTYPIPVKVWHLYHLPLFRSYQTSKSKK